MTLAEIEKFTVIWPINPFVIVALVVGAGLVFLAIAMALGLPLFPTKRRKQKRRS